MKTLLLLEGGALRGMYTAGVLDILLENNIDVDAIVGVSAGALIAPNYFSKQKGRVIRLNKKYCNDQRYISKRSLMLTGNLVNKKFAYYEVNKNLDPFDELSFEKANKKLYVVITNVKTGKAEYRLIKNIFDDMEIFRASSAMPFVTKMVTIDDNKYLDGAISDSIPIDFCMSLNYDKIIVVLTQKLGYKKKPFSMEEKFAIRAKYHKYSNFLESMYNRYAQYNSSLEKVNKLEEDKKIFVFRPSESVQIDITKASPEAIEKIYNVGINDARKNIDNLKKYLNID